MKRTFADTSYWIAALDPTDQWRETVRKAAEKIGNTEIVTSETVLIEVLNYFSEHRAEIKKESLIRWKLF